VAEDPFEELKRIGARNRQARLDRVATAKLVAPIGKEPIDLERIKTLSTTDALGKDDAELLLWLEERYYIDEPRLMTLVQLAALVETYTRG
jgi:hypothetical protein